MIDQLRADLRLLSARLAGIDRLLSRPEAAAAPAATLGRLAVAVEVATGKLTRTSTALVLAVAQVLAEQQAVEAGRKRS